MSEEMKKSASLDQERANEAWKMAGDCRREYTNAAKSAPALIMSNGLIQTLAYFENKDAQTQKLNRDLAKWLGKLMFDESFDNGKALIEKLVKCDSSEYMRATEETLAILKWIKLFASIREEKKS